MNAVISVRISVASTLRCKGSFVLEIWIPDLGNVFRKHEVNAINTRIPCLLMNGIRPACREMWFKRISYRFASTIIQKIQMKFSRIVIGICKNLFPRLIVVNTAVTISVTSFEYAIIIMKAELQFAGIWPKPTWTERLGPNVKEAEGSILKGTRMKKQNT
jgi:hypothetical protein